MKQLLEAGAHFGHQTRRWNPKMAPFIYTQRNGVHIMDLQKTSQYLDEAYRVVKDISSSGGEILFVGTKKQAAESIKEEAVRAGAPYINARWLGGTLTNYRTICKRITYLYQLTTMSQDGTFDLMPKKEILKLNAKIQKLEKFIGGIKDMKGLPAALFVVDSKKEKIAVTEANKLGIPVVALVDTNCDPDLINHIIPANDDAIRTVRLMCTTIANAVIEGREGETKTELKPCVVEETSKTVETVKPVIETASEIIPIVSEAASKVPVEITEVVSEENSVIPIIETE
jgi:small subunit ribosomal protein S2